MLRRRRPKPGVRRLLDRPHTRTMTTESMVTALSYLAPMAALPLMSLQRYPGYSLASRRARSPDGACAIRVRVTGPNQPKDDELQPADRILDRTLPGARERRRLVAGSPVAIRRRDGACLPAQSDCPAHGALGG